MINESKSGWLIVKCVTWFFASALTILVLTAMAKGIAASGAVRILAHPDPLLGILTNRQTMIVAIVLEVLVVGLVVREHDTTRKAAMVAWISSVFLAYRAGLWSIGYQGSCSCLGNVTDTLGISPGAADLMSGAMLAYLLIGSYWILVWKVRSHARAGRGGLLIAG
jgi:hypothetical protein